MMVPIGRRLLLLLLTDSRVVLLRSAEWPLGGAVGRRADVRRAHAVGTCDSQAVYQLHEMKPSSI